MNRSRRKFLGEVLVLPVLIKLPKAETAITLRINDNLIDFEDIALDIIDGKYFLDIKVLNDIQDLWDNPSEIDLGYIGPPKHWALYGYDSYCSPVHRYRFQDLKSYRVEGIINSQEARLFYERYMLDSKRIVRGCYEPV